eukprot:GDKH01002639.1.p3 GENE.GDKH01002639.1~~GDKH01002639.1.p3  ORF type:complete len:66 (+),score=2.12 GDKH01002639.1:118-315(+)
MGIVTETGLGIQYAQPYFPDEPAFEAALLAAAPTSPVLELPRIIDHVHPCFLLFTSQRCFRSEPL